MSKRVDISGQIFNDILVLEYVEKKNTHALWKCLCMLCNKITYKTYSNLIYGNSKSCQSCGQRISNGLEQDIFWETTKNSNVAQVARKFNVARAVVCRVKKENNAFN